MDQAPRDAFDHPDPLRRLTLDELRLRTSMKWRTYPDDVLPLWVAEMDVPLAAPVVRAITEAVARGDTGYPSGTAYARALADFARTRWNWPGLAVERTAIVPDVMLGVVEMLKLVTGPGDPVVVNCPVYPPFYQFVTHMDRRVVEAPLGEDLRIDFTVLEGAFRHATAGGAGPRICCAVRTIPRARCTARRNWRRWRRWRTGTAYGSSPTRSMHRWWLSTPPSCLI